MRPIPWRGRGALPDKLLYTVLARTYNLRICHSSTSFESNRYHSITEKLQFGYDSTRLIGCRPILTLLEQTASSAIALKDVSEGPRPRGEAGRGR